jgi:hypothetical protein
MNTGLISAFLLSLFLSVSQIPQNGNVTIYGTNKDYAGKELEFYIYKERVFNTQESVAKIKVDDNGTFSINFSIVDTKCIYCQTPLYLTYIYAEPGKSYRVELPPATAKSEENINNPFFSPPQWHILPITEENSEKPELNAAINNFDQQFDPFQDNQLLLYYDPQHNREKLDSFELVVNKLPLPENKEFFQTYRLYKLAVLGLINTQFDYKDLYRKYIKNKTAMPDVPSWWEFFNLYFDGYFNSLSVKKEYSELYSLVGKGQYYALNLLLKADSALQNNQLREWALIKEIHVGYFRNGLPLTIVNTLCDSLIAETTDKLSISMAEILKKDASALIPGSYPPGEILLNTEGDSLDMGSLRGKYSYIGFCSLDNLGCQKEFEYLKYLYHKHGKFLEFVIIVPESEKDRISAFSYENSIPWKFWYAPNSSSITKNYKIKAYPVFYLLDREGKFIMSPASLPSAGFEQQLFNILKSKKEL